MGGQHKQFGSQAALVFSPDPPTLTCCAPGHAPGLCLSVSHGWESTTSTGLSGCSEGVRKRTGVDECLPANTVIQPGLQRHPHFLT